MGQIVGGAAKPKRCNLNQLSQLGILAAGEHVLVSYDNSMNAAGQGNFDRYIVGDGRTAATALELKYLDDSTRPYIVEEVNRAVADIQPIEITGDVTNAPDEEDLTSEEQGNTDVLKFKDKAYNSALYSGLGRTYLRKNISGGKNILTQAMVNTANTIYHIQYDYDLNGQTITLPAGCVLEFDGGSVNNGTINATDLKIEAGSEKIFSSIQGSINTNSIIDCRWFGDNCSDINDIIALFGACHIMLRGDFVHDATIVVPYDVQIDAKDATINTAQDIPVIRLYAGIYDINLDGLVINVSTGYANNVVEVFGSSNPNISGYDLSSDYQPISINLPKVYGATQTSARDDNATAYYISSSNTGKNFYEHLYFAYIKGAAKNIHRAMRVDMSDGEFSSNVVNLKCWWCPIGLSSNIHFNDSCKVNILYQCNDYSAKLIQCDSNDYYSGGAAYNIDIWDEQHIATVGGFIENTLKDKYTTSFTERPAKMSLNKYFLYNTSNTGNDNALTYNAQNMQGLSSLDIDNQYLLRIIERDGVFGYANNQSCILNLVDYTNKNFLKTTTYTIVYGGNRFTPSGVIGWFQGLLKFDESDIFSTSRIGYIKVTCIVPNFTTSTYTTRLVSNVRVEIYEESTTQKARFFYEVVYINTAQKVYVRLLNAMLYNGIFSSASAINGSTISTFNGGLILNNTIYDIDGIGKNPICKFTLNSFPSNDQEITVNLFGKTVTFSVSGCSSVAEFVGKLAWGIDRNASSMHVTDMSGTYLTITSDVRFAASLTSYTIRGGGTTYATGASGGSWGKENTYKINNSLHKGTTANRPTLASGDAGFTYWDTTLSKMIAWNGSAWVNLDGTALS